MSRLALLNQLSELCFRMNPSWTRTSSDKELEQYLVDGIKETERELQETKALLLLAQAELAALKAKAAVPAGYVMVPVEPTPEMVDAADQAYMPFGDMKLAVMLANLVPAVPKGVSDESHDSHK